MIKIVGKGYPQMGVINITVAHQKAETVAGIALILLVELCVIGWALRGITICQAKAKFYTCLDEENNHYNSSGNSRLYLPASNKKAFRPIFRSDRMLSLFYGNNIIPAIENHFHQR